MQAMVVPGATLSFHVWPGSKRPLLPGEAPAQTVYVHWFTTSKAAALVKVNNRPKGKEKRKDIDAARFGFNKLYEHFCIR
ncbi:unnamed protein product [Dovyalis caffra]|uniref:Uncharacterized protein n=1 Tax=Dovyalis caffra TaxID=77055 RepID=A0AAV1RI86_9ROSI|nr:unnamed protein product [Dovyalis caffra]